MDREVRKEVSREWSNGFQAVEKSHRQDGKGFEMKYAENVSESFGNGSGFVRKPQLRQNAHGDSGF